MKKIVFLKKSHKMIVGLSLLVALMFASASLFTAQSAFAKEDDTNSNDKAAEFAAYVSNDGVYMSDLKDNNPVLIEKGNDISLPKISRNGKNVAYTKQNNLYVYNIETKEISEVGKNIGSYEWNNKGNLIYALVNSGLSMYDTNLKQSTNLIVNEYNYYNIKCNSKDKIYANKELSYTQGDNQCIKMIGIITYDLDSKEEKILLESKEGNNKKLEQNSKMSELMESLGSRPILSSISNDDKYLYIWNKAKAGSLSTDMTEFTAYDLENNKFIENDDMIALAYKDNISQNPVNSDYVALNKGENREMYDNKNVGIYNLKDKTFISLIPEDIASMTIDYSSDGKNILYSGTAAIKDVELKNPEEWEKQIHYIYEVNTNTKEIKQITSGIFFDFMPKYLNDNEIMFVRKINDSFSLWKTKGGIETKIADSLNFKPYDFYGHYSTEYVVDVFKGEK